MYMYIPCSMYMCGTCMYGYGYMYLCVHVILHVARMFIVMHNNVQEHDTNYRTYL